MTGQQPIESDSGQEGESPGPVFVDRGTVVLVALMLAIIGWYFWDAASRSTRVTNLILIVPMSIAALLIGGSLLGAALLRLHRAGWPRAEADPDSASNGRLAAVAVLLVAYAFSLEFLGLDLATILFLSGSFTILGVRGWFGLVLAPVSLGFLIVFAMKAAFYIHIPTTFLAWM